MPRMAQTVTLYITTRPITITCLVTEAEFVLRAEAEVDDTKATDVKQRSGDGEGSHPDAGYDDPGVTTGTIDAEAEWTSDSQ